MPDNQSSKVGTSSSPMINRVIQNSKGGQVPTTSVSEALGAKFTTKPVDVK